VHGLTADGNTAVGNLALRDNLAGANTAVGNNALVSNSTGNQNTAVGSVALQRSNGSDNAALGSEALRLNTTGSQNTAAGSEALRGHLNPNTGQPDSSGSYNTAAGFPALYSNFSGGGNVADGWQALFSNSSGGFNTATGVSALRTNTTGNQNTATGVNALYFNNGQSNTAAGFKALEQNTSGSNNVALGLQAGQNLTTGSNNIVIGAGVLGTAGESNTTRIGKSTQVKTPIGGIYGKTVASASAVAEFIDNTGKLGTIKSSARYKDNIKPMDKASEAILQLEPVTFRYKHELDPDGVTQFGLIAEQVEKVDPNLVVRDEDGKVSTVRYEAVNAMLLNEFLKERRKLEDYYHELVTEKAKAEEQGATIHRLEGVVAAQEKRIESLCATVQKVSARVELQERMPRLTGNGN
jgi:hypothetical protein